MTLRNLELDDWRAVHALASLPESSRYQPWGPNTKADTRAFVQAAVDLWEQSPRQRFVYVACLAGEIVGLGELKVRDRVQRQAEISYVVHPRVWGRGVATATGLELLSTGFDKLKLHRVFATCDPRNVASHRVLVKLGMTYEGCLRQTVLLRDGWRDSEVFSLLDHEWDARAG